MVILKSVGNKYCHNHVALWKLLDHKSDPRVSLSLLLFILEDNEV